MELQFNGLVAVAIFFATIAILSIVTVVTLLAAIYQYKFGDSSRLIAGQSVFDFFLASAGILAVDIFLFAIFSSGPRVLSAKEAASLDSWMFYIWGPVHIIVYVMTVLIIKRVRHGGRNLPEDL